MKRRLQAGNALMEFALVLPFLALVSVSVFDLGRFVYFGIVVGNAARAGAQYGAQNSSTALDSAGMIAAAQNDGSNNDVGTISSPAPAATQFCTYWNTATQSSAPNPSCAQSSGDNHLVRYVRVTVSGEVKTSMQYMSLPAALQTSSTATMRVIGP